MLFQALQGIAQGPVLPFVSRPIPAGVVAGGMGRGAVGIQLYQGRAATCACPVSGPAGGGKDSEKIIAVHTQAGDAVADAPRGKGVLIASRHILMSGNSPLVVHDVQNNRRAVHRTEGEGIVKIRLCAGTLTNPGNCDVFRFLVFGRHGPADGLGKLGAQVAGNGKEIMCIGTIQDRHLPALQFVPGVGQTLTHHVQQGIAARDQQTLLPVGRKQHVAVIQGHALGHRYGFFAGALQVERQFALTLHPEHAFVIEARQQHITQSVAQHLRRQFRVPGADSPVVVIQDAYHAEGQVFGRAGRNQFVRTLQFTGPG